MRFSLQKKFFLAFFFIAALLVLLTTGVMHRQLREGFDEYITRAKIQRLGKVESVLMYMYQQDGSLDVLRKSGAWADLLTSVEAVRRDQLEQEIRSRNGTSVVTPTAPPRNPEAVAREDKAIASSVSIMLQSRGEPTSAPSDSIPPYARGVALLDANGFFLAGETVEDTKHATYVPIRNPQKQTIAYWVVAHNALAYDALGRSFLNEQFEGALLMLIAAAVLSALIAWLLSMHFRRPIADLLTGFRAVAAGNLSTRLSTGQGNELGDVAAHFNRMATQLEAQESARHQWIADTSHELRTPLTILRMRTEAMRDGIVAGTEEEWQRSIKAIEDLTLLVEDLQSMARATADGWDLSFERIEVNRWLGETVDDYKPAFEKAGLAIQYVPMDEEMVIQGDVQRLQQVLRNVLVNSMRYTDAPGQVKITAQAMLRKVKITIHDSAPTVPDAALPHLFDRFYRVDGSRNRATGGSGLGLAISEGIVKAHQGSISAAHSDLGGLSIVIVLPIEQTAVNAVDKEGKRSFTKEKPNRRSKWNLPNASLKFYWSKMKP